MLSPSFSPGLRCKRDGLGQNQAARYILPTGARVSAARVVLLSASRILSNGSVVTRTVIYFVLLLSCSFPTAGLLRVVESLSKGSVELGAAVFPQEAGRLMAMHSILRVDKTQYKHNKREFHVDSLFFSFWISVIFFALTWKSATFVKCRVYGASCSALVISSGCLVWFNVNEIDWNEEFAQNVLFVWWCCEKTWVIIPFNVWTSPLFVSVPEMVP